MEKEKLLKEIAKYERLVSLYQSTSRTAATDDAHLLQSGVMPKPYQLVNKNISTINNSDAKGRVFSHNNTKNTSKKLKCTMFGDQNPYKWKKPVNTKQVNSHDINVSSNTKLVNLSLSTQIKIRSSKLSTKQVGNQSVTVDCNSYKLDRSNKCSTSNNNLSGAASTDAKSSQSSIIAMPKLSLQHSLSNISETYKKLISSVQKSLEKPDGPSENSLHADKQWPQINKSSSNIGSLKYKITVHKSNTKVLNKYVPKMKKPVVKTSTKIVNKFVTPPQNRTHYQQQRRHKCAHSYVNKRHSAWRDKRNYSMCYHNKPNASSSGKQEIVTIDGQLYRKINNSLSNKPQHKTVGLHQHTNIANIKEKEVKVVHIRGVAFSLSNNGQRLQRVENKTPVGNQIKVSSLENSLSTPNRFRLGSAVFVRKSQAEYIKGSNANVQKIASKKVTKSVDVIRKLKLKESKKSQYCLYYNRFGRCSKGEECRFIHDPNKIAVCTRFLRGNCKVTDCPFSHEASENKMPACRFFLESYCNKASCPYLHVNVGKNAGVCSAFQTGFCSRGKECDRLHTFVCKEFRRSGVCSRGKGCKLTHITPLKYRDRREETSAEGKNEQSIGKSSSCPSFLVLPTSDDENDQTESDDDEEKSCRSLSIFAHLGETE